MFLKGRRGGAPRGGWGDGMEMEMGVDVFLTYAAAAAASFFLSFFGFWMAMLGRLYTMMIFLLILIFSLTM